jgi:16S rRNA (guanine966-N2)-methyltransferase
MFSIVGDRIIGARVVDLYAGTGSLGIEALSRGAASVAFVEADRAACRILQANVERCRALASDVQICACRVETFLRRDKTWAGPYDLVLADPPYAETSGLLDAMRAVPATRFADHALMVIEHGRKTTLPSRVGPYRLLRRYDYGDTSLSLLHHTVDVAGAS